MLLLPAPLSAAGITVCETIENTRLPRAEAEGTQMIFNSLTKVSFQLLRPLIGSHDTLIILILGSLKLRAHKSSNSQLFFPALRQIHGRAGAERRWELTLLNFAAI